MSFQVGDTYPLAVTVRDADGALADPDTRTLSVRKPNGVLLDSATAEALIVHPGTGLFTADVPLALAGMYVIAFSATEPDQYAEVQVWVSPAGSPVFCTSDDVATRLGRGDAGLTAAEVPQVEMLCELATAAITDAVAQTEAWRAALPAVPHMLRVVAIELVTRGLANTSGMASTTETLGAYSYTARFRDANGGGGLLLTPAEARMVRRAVYGRATATTMPTGTLTQVIELVEDGDIESGVTG
jgi:hypothetical protein